MMNVISSTHWRRRSNKCNDSCECSIRKFTRMAEETSCAEALYTHPHTQNAFTSIRRTSLFHKFHDGSISVRLQIKINTFVGYLHRTRTCSQTWRWKMTMKRSRFDCGEWIDPKYLADLVGCTQHHTRSIYRHKKYEFESYRMFVQSTNSRRTWMEHRTSMYKLQTKWCNQNIFDLIVWPPNRNM